MTNEVEEFFEEIGAELQALWAKLFGTPGESISAIVANDCTLIGNGLTGALSAFEAISGIDSDTLTRLQNYISKIQQLALSVTSTVATNVAKPIITQIIADYAALKADTASLTLPGVVSTVFKAVDTLLPYIEAAVGLLTKASVALHDASGMNADEARLELAAAAKP